MDKQKQPLTMKLTPIRMRGKRKSNHSTTGTTGSGSGSSSSYPNSDSDTAAARAALTLSSPSLPLKRSRASSPASQKKSALSSSSASASAPALARRARTKKPVPFDQRFPLEVIERIFFYSMNFNLPRASPRFGWMLSSRHTLRDLVFAAFGPQWNLTLTQRRYKQPLRKDKTGARKAQARLSDAALQTAVLNSPWMKMDVLVEAMQIWLQKNKDKRYLHTPIPFSEDPNRSIASKFVLNLNDFDALVKEHPTEHILSTQLFNRSGRGESDEDFDEYEEERDYEDEEDAFRGSDRGSAWGSDEDADHISDKDSDESEQEDGNEDNEDNEQENRTETENPTNDSTAPLVSAHACFAIDQYFFLQNMYHVNKHDPKPHETPSALREGERRYEMMNGVALITYRMTVGTTFLCGPSLGKAQIPEWLQLAGGPYPASQNQSRQGRKALRDRLRATFDMLSWIVFSGGKLQKEDGWELTWQGYQNLLAVDVRRNDWDAYEDGEDVVAACEHASASPREKTIRLQYSVDTLVSGLLGLFYVLGVFYHQMPRHILESSFEMATDRAVSGDAAYQETQTYLILRRIAFLIPPNNEKSLLARLPESWGVKV